MEELFAIGDRVTVLRDGRHVGTRRIGETTMAELVRMMVGRDLKDQFPKQRAAVGEEVLRVEHFAATACLHDISFALRRGEVVGLAGSMGSAGRSLRARSSARIGSMRGGCFVRGRGKTHRPPRRAIDLGLRLSHGGSKATGAGVGFVRAGKCLPAECGPLVTGGIYARTWRWPRRTSALVSCGSRHPAHCSAS